MVLKNYFNHLICISLTNPLCISTLKAIEGNDKYRFSKGYPSLETGRG